MSPEYRALTRQACQHETNAARLTRAASDSGTDQALRGKYAAQIAEEETLAADLRDKLAAMRAASLAEAA